MNVFTFLDRISDCRPPKDCGALLQNSRVSNRYLKRRTLSNKSAVTAATEIEASGRQRRCQIRDVGIEAHAWLHKRMAALIAKSA